MYVQSNTLLLKDLFLRTFKMCLQIYEIIPARFLTEPGLAWQATLKITKIKWNLLTDNKMLVMVEKCIKEEEVTVFIDMQELITNTWIFLYYKYLCT